MDFKSTLALDHNESSRKNFLRRKCHNYFNWLIFDSSIRQPYWEEREIRSLITKKEDQWNRKSKKKKDHRIS